MAEKIILLGASGQLGRQLRATRPEDIELLPLGHTELDICDSLTVKSLFQTFQPTQIINAAAYTKVDAAEKNSDVAFAVNAHGPEVLAENCPASCRIIHISTDFVFDGKSEQPYQPYDETRPISIYGKSKLEGERNLQSLRPDSVVIRTAWLYSAQGKNFLNTMLRLMAEREELGVVADQFGTPTSVNSLAEIIWRFIAKPELHGIYHWTDQGKASWFEFASEIQRLALEAKLLDKKIPIRALSTEQYPTLARRPAYSVLDKELTYLAIGKTGQSWEAELKRVLADI
jgi:dTDP-4-dehydrorhamnose reductase